MHRPWPQDTRLGWVAHRVPPGARVADIGTDHARLPVYLLATKRASFCVAADVSPEAIQASRERKLPDGVGAHLSYRVGDGLEVLTPEDRIDTIIFTGFGGHQIADCLERRPPHELGAGHLLIQPQRHPEQVRGWIARNGWALTDEALVEDHDRVYLVLEARRDATPPPPHPTLSPEELPEIGPIPARSRCPRVRRQEAGERVEAAATPRAREAAERQLDLARRVLEGLPGPR